MKHHCRRPNQTRLIWILLLGAGFFQSISGCGTRVSQPPEISLHGIDAVTRHALATQLEHLKKNLSRPESWGALGILLKESQQDELAVFCFNQARIIDKNDPKWIYLLGWSCLPQSPEKAVEPLKTATRLAKARDPDNPVPLLRLAEAYQGLGLASEERTVLELVPSGPPFGDLANLRLAELDWEEGRDQEFRERIKQIPDRPNWRKRLTLLKIALAGLENQPEKQAMLKGQEKSFTDDVSWIDPYLRENRPIEEGLKGAFQNAWNHESRGDFSEAIRQLEKILSLESDSRAWVGLVRCQMKARNLEKAQKVLVDARKVFPDNVQLRVIGGELALQNGLALGRKQKWNEGRALWMDALTDTEISPRKDSEDEDLLKIRSRLAFWLDDREALLRGCEKLLFLKPGHLGARVFQSWARHTGGTPQEISLFMMTQTASLDNSAEEQFPETAAVIRRISFPLGEKTADRPLPDSSR